MVGSYVWAGGGCLGRLLVGLRSWSSSPAVLLCPVLLVVGLVVGVFVSLAFCARVVCFSLVWGSLFLLRCGLYVSLQEGMAFWIGKRWENADTLRKLREIRGTAVPPFCPYRYIQKGMCSYRIIVNGRKIVTHLDN